MTAPAPRAPSSPPPSPGHWSPAALFALGIILIGICVRALTTYSPFPYWDLDPSIMPVPQTGLTGLSLASLDTLTTLAALVVLWSRRRALAPGMIEAALLTLGLSVLCFHQYRAFTSPDSREALQTASTWAAAWATAFALFAATRDPHHPRIARTCLAILLGLIAALAAKSILQVTIEHAETVANYRADRAAFLSAQGWDPSSDLARSFERRLLQREASGWFGLANVLAAAGAVGAITSAFLLLGCWRTRPAAARAPLLPGLALLLSTSAGLTCVALAGSKQGWAALGAGLLAPVLIHLLVPLLPSRAALLGRLVLIAVPLSVLALLCLRGLLGERLGELSLLFRWFYLEASARIAAHSPLSALLGIGPGAFRDFYLRFKNPLSPEEIASPHNLPVEYLVTLGLAGLALAALWARLLAHPGSSLALARINHSTSALADPPATPGVRFVIYVPVLATIAAFAAEIALTTPETALARFLGLGMWILIALAVYRLALPAYCWAAAGVGGAATLAFTGMLDLGPVTPGSAALLLGWLALAAALSLSSAAPLTARPFSRPVLPLLCTLPALLTSILAVAALAPLEARLASSAAAVQPLAVARARLTALTTAPSSSSRDSIAALAAELRVPADPVALDRALISLEFQTWPQAAETLLATRDAKAAQSATSLLLRAAQHALTLDRPADAALLFTRAWESTVPLRPAATAFAWRATVAENLAALPGPQPATDFHAAALDSLLSAAAADPYNPAHAARLARLARTGSISPGGLSSAAWARRALALDALRRLDPLRQFRPAERAELEALAAAQPLSAPAPTPAPPPG